MKLGTLATGALLLGLAISAPADTVQWNGIGLPNGNSAGLTVSVSAILTNVGSSLQIQLLNRNAATDPTQILTGLLFDLAPGAAPVGTLLASANSDAGSGIYTATTTVSGSTELRRTILGGNNGWSYQAPPAGAYNGTTFQYGFAASGLGGAFSGGGNEDWGIIGLGSNLGQSNLNNKLPLVRSTGTGASSATFVISNFTRNASDIRNLTFAFALTNSNRLNGVLVPVVPEPSSIVLCGSGLALGLLAARRRRRATS